MHSSVQLPLKYVGSNILATYGGALLKAAVPVLLVLQTLSFPIH